MTYHTIRYEMSEGLAVITLDRPEVMNALNAAMRRELTEALHRARGEARAIVLTGSGRAFCSGQDLGDGATEGLNLETVLREEYEPLLQAIYSCPLPVLAAVNGAAAGAGANLALAADVVIAAQSAAFMQAFARIGLMPDAGGTWWLPRQVGIARAMGMALFAEKIGAEEAARIGLIWEAVPDVDFEHHWRARAAHLAKGPTAAFGALKRAFHAGLTNPLSAQLALEARLQGELGRSADFREGVLAFLEKRPPHFTGR
ncbi:2-(1,2-epoxy-1,2-dihydrophenyl)acetyl-CoA isomerase [Rhodobacter capsulatus]|uniref:2-(1,2-epoxy-1,2-dihydrophenyl)acetyl-CoA isomerase n=1 Tax=Rhodobacter capsulatus TaxID=1061 RepID=A0A4U1JNQ0_RHOCA|nr:enoyl-CoA hydratase-related protein [Rhodobacter capsulatus]TKD14670.1 2-(1,2-epoxy-1,2-dihydrophenyl)acetyl-CoA isomerase [Rhodobacter capsulatus]